MQGQINFPIKLYNKLLNILINECNDMQFTNKLKELLIRKCYYQWIVKWYITDIQE